MCHVFSWGNHLFSFYCNLFSTILASTLTNSELLYYFHGEKQKESYYLCTVGGMVVEDLPQFLIQLIFAVRANRFYGKPVNGTQWFSFAFTYCRFCSTLALKAMRSKNDAPEVIEVAFQTYELANAVVSL